MSHMVIDVREPEEFARGHVPGAINMPPADILAGAKQIQGIPKDTPLILYCMTGARSNAAINILQEMGFTNLTNGINKDQVAARYKM